MPGFLITNMPGGCEMSCAVGSPCVTGSFEAFGCTVARCTLDKYMRDKLFCSDSDGVFVTEGVILNSAPLSRIYGGDFLNAVKRMRKKDGNYFKEFRGSFSGADYNPAQDKWTAYTGQIGDKPVFYYSDNGRFILSSSLDWAVETLRNSGVGYTLDKTYVYDMLTYGFMATGKADSTPVAEIKRLPAGCCAEVSGGTLSVRRYHQFTNTPELPDSMTEAEIIELIDERFRIAVSLEMDKDLEYGYRHLFTLSGGLDSRMALWVAKDMGYSGMLAITFCQSGTLDETISKQVADYLGVEHMVKTLNDVAFIKSLDETVAMNHGLSQYLGTAHGKSMYRLINMEPFGAMHTGQIGGVVIGSHCTQPFHQSADQPTGLHSEILADKVDMSGIDYENDEMYYLYTRGFRGAMCSQIANTCFNELLAPFCDVDFFELCMRIPLKYRCGHYIYKKWIISKYPDAAQFRWERIRAKITDSRMKIKLARAVRKLRRILGITKDDRKMSMNPKKYWYDNDIGGSASFMDGYFNEAMESLELDAQMKDDIKRVYDDPKITGKYLALTALAAIKRYHPNLIG